VFEAHNIRYFFYAGGNDSQDTADKISKLAQKKEYELRVIGVPKTIDNDLVTTDHCPGYGSVVKYICTVLKETALDHEAMGQHDLVSIIEVMGRNAGWIAAGATLAKGRENPHDAPHLIYLPELPFSKEKFVEDVQNVLKKNKYCLVVVGEGLLDKDGNYIANTTNAQDSFGHQQLGGVGDYLAGLVEENLAVKARSSKLGTGQRAAAHCSSQTDNDEAFMAGQAAVKAAIAGETDKMVILVRAEGENYQCETGLADLSEIANGVKEIPADWISEDGVSMSAKFIKYCQPLIQGEVEVPYENGVPAFVRLSRKRIRKVLDAHEFE
jgi:6-phosphofructokinase 1